MKESIKGWAKVVLVAVLSVGAVLGIIACCSGMDADMQRQEQKRRAAEQECRDMGGEVLHQRGDDVCIKDGKIIKVLPW